VENIMKQRSAPAFLLLVVPNCNAGRTAAAAVYMTLLSGCVAPESQPREPGTFTATLEGAIKADLTGRGVRFDQRLPRRPVPGADRFIILRTGADLPADGDTLILFYRQVEPFAVGSYELKNISDPDDPIAHVDIRLNDAVIRRFVSLGGTLTITAATQHAIDGHFTMLARDGASPPDTLRARGTFTAIDTTNH
jgi:hypothetical protein